MPREHGRLRVSINQDEDFTDLRPLEQWLYARLLARADINQAGVLPLNLRKWARMSNHIEPVEVRGIADGLATRRFLILDYDTDEALVRTFIRNDDVWKQPHVLMSACASAMAVESPAIRDHLAVEIAKVRDDALSPLKEKTRARLEPKIDEALRVLAPGGPRDPSVNPKPNPSGNPKAKGSSNPSDEPKQEPFPEGFTEPMSEPPGEVEGEGAPSRGGLDPSSSDADAPDVESSEPGRDGPGFHPQADALCERLVARVVENGAKKPTVSKVWRQNARLLIDKDERDFDEACRLIDWAQADSFWRGNIMSIPTFREKYDQLRFKARESARWRIAAPPGQRDQLTDAEVRAILQPPHRDYLEPPEEIEDDPAARSAWFKKQRDERMAQYRADANHLLETSEAARHILARLRRSS
jgi:hypothetical protein